MKRTIEEEIFIEKVRLISGKSKYEINDVISSIITLLVLDYLEGKETSFPLFGKIKLSINSLKPTLVHGKKETFLIVNVIPHSFLKKVIGQVIDGEENEIEKILKKKIQYLLKKYSE